MGHTVMQIPQWMQLVSRFEKVCWFFANDITSTRSRRGAARAAAEAARGKLGPLAGSH